MTENELDDRIKNNYNFIIGIIVNIKKEGIKMKYEKPIVEVIELDLEDIVCLSPSTGDNDDDTWA